jgi:choline dehydrogenase-like flavoprotein
VCVVEAGGLTPDPAVQSIYEGDSIGLHYSTSATRLRYFGGSSNHWGGYCRPLDPIDFEARDWVPNSGWPFGIDELAPWYEPASRIVEVAPGRFDDRGYWQQVTSDILPQPATGRLRLQFVHFSPPTRFGSRYGGNLQSADNIEVLLNANVTRIAAAENGSRVNELEVRTLTGKRHSVRAGRYVLAAGGLENARILLLSNDVAKAGLGNDNDLVGRFFMEHVHVSGFGEAVVADPERLPKILYRRVEAEGRSAQAAFNPTAAFLRRERLLNATFMVGMAGNYPLDAEPDRPDDREPAHRDMLRAARPLLTGSQAASDGDSHTLGAWLGLGGSCEQAPNPNSRVGLSERRDALGLPRISLDWRLTEQDRLSFYRHLHSLALEFGALGIGRMRKLVPGETDWPQPVGGGSHHMGTTRMSDSPRHGVVDRNCRVHGIGNLYLAGSSIFPTSGVSNPTLTIIALTLRLADHLGGEMR